MCQPRAACLRSPWHFFHKVLFSIPCGLRESISLGRNQVPLALSFLNLFSESESLNNAVLCLHNSFEGSLPLQSHKSEQPWKLEVVEEDFSAFHFQSRWATEDPQNRCYNSCPRGCQLAEQNLADVPNGTTGGRGCLDRSFQSLSSSHLQKTLPAYPIHQQILKVKERERGLGALHPVSVITWLAWCVSRAPEDWESVR